MFEDTNWDKFIRKIANDEKEFSEQMKNNSVLSPTCNCGSIKLESTPCPIHDLNRSICPACECQIDADTCWCGAELEGYGYADCHSFIPVGCRCGFAKGD